MAIKNVIFDLGKVLIDYDFDIFFGEIGYKPEERNLDEGLDPILDFESGKISKIEFLEQMKDVYNFSLSLEKFEIIWAEVFSEMENMLALARKVSENYKVFIFSNTDEIHFPYIWEKFPKLHFFNENLMLSYELNSVKPDKEIYQNAIEKFSLVPEESIFIDDRPINIKVAQEFGFDGIIHRDLETTNLELKKKLKI
ncbi:MAG: HAD family phosphatase [Candidatus Cloacimonetes bacterium]|nr:HAD family phosphatase [Candidatus Cloacimonadota bacterium]